MKKVFYITMFSVFTISNLQALLVKGDPLAATNETFSFEVGFATFDAGSDLSAPRLWIASGQAIADDSAKPYGLSFVTQLASYVDPGIQPSATAMANEENATIYTFNGTTASSTSATNPIWGNAFHLFDVSKQRPVFSIVGNEQKIYTVQNIERYTNSSKNITELLEHDFGAGEVTHALVAFADTIFAAHATGSFGANPSKITELTKSSFVVSEIKDKNGKVTSQVTIPYLKTVADTTIDVATTALRGGSANNLAALGSNVSLSMSLNRLYIGVDATANGDADGRAVALTFATLKPDSNTPVNYSFEFNDMMPSAVTQAANFNTVVSTDTSNQVRISKTAGMVTSTGLYYLIVARDSGTGPQNVYALPIVSIGSDSGKIADFTQIKNSFTLRPTLFNSRHFDTVISDANQIDLAGAFIDQLQVGTAQPPLDICDIEQIYTVGDSVFVVISYPYATGTKPGTFQSQPIFAKDGHIAGWTPWQRVLGSDQQMLCSFIDRKTISGFYVSAQTPSATPSFKSVYQTTFISNSFLAPFLEKCSDGGLQGLFSFPATTSGFDNAISLLISTGFSHCAIGQTGKVDTDFKINPMTDADVVTFSKDTINDHQALIACEIAHNGIDHWIFVGGVSGVSVLTDDTTGVTWNGNLANIDTGSLAAGQTFKLVGDFKFVKKLVWDTQYLYILTSNELYRILLDPDKFTATPTADLNPELILTASSLSKNASYFLDLVVDDGFCIIGTTNGMFSLDITSQKSLKKITIPDGLPAISKLLLFSAAIEPQRSFKNLSNLYVLNNSFGTQQARINRFVIQDSAVTAIDDYIIGQKNSSGLSSGVPSSFIKFDNYISSYFTNGTWNLASSYYLGPHQPANTRFAASVLQLFTGIRSGFSSSQMILPMFSAYAPLFFLNNATNLAGFTQDSVSGSLICFGSFNAHVNA